MTDLPQWFKARHKWLQEAAKRLVEKDTLEESDYSDLVDLCRSEADGDLNELDWEFPATLFTKPTFDSLRLLSIGEIRGINTLAPNKPLTFGKGSLSVVYGQNGSGKSGYVRILKHLCNPQEPGSLLPDVFSTEEPTQTCTVGFTVNEEERNLRWSKEDGHILDLQFVDVFDAATGRVLIEKDNEVSYEPRILSFFSDLISVCEQVFQRLDSEARQLLSKKPTLPPEFFETFDGKWYDNLSDQTTLEEIQLHCGWGDAEESELGNLTQRLSEQSPENKAIELRRQKEFADNLIGTLTGFLETLSPDECNRIKNMKRESVIQRNAAEIAAKDLFAGVPLQGVGSEVWKVLWRSAIKYSEESAYVGVPFPNTGDNARCVLCQQILLDEGRGHFQSFEEFMKGEAQRSADKTAEELASALSRIGDLPTQDELAPKFAASKLFEGDEKNPFEITYSALRERKKQLGEGEPDVPNYPVPDTEVWIEEAKKQAEGFEALASKYDEDAKTGDRESLEKQRRELQVRKWLSQQREAVDAEIALLRKKATLKKAIGLTNTGTLSKKKGTLTEDLITKAYVERFEKELENLGAKRIKVELLKGRVDHGHVHHRICLTGVPEGPTMDVLSEGEHRIVSLAAFLADVTGKETATPFIFDDPISSLDQDFEEAVVRRLVEISSQRQVIVFTHRISLLSLIRDTAKREKQKVEIVCLRKEMWGTGQPGSIPLYGRNPKNAINELKDHRLSRAKTILETEGRETYEPEAKSLCSETRILIERMIESVLLGDVVQRFRRSIATQQIRSLSRIKDVDCVFLDLLMTKYSRYEHSQPDESPVSLPQPDELETDLDSLKTWLVEFNDRSVGS